MTYHDWLILLGVPTTISLVTGLVIGACWLAAKRSVAKTPKGPPQFWAVPESLAARGWVCVAATEVEKGDPVFYDPRTNTVSRIPVSERVVVKS